MQMIMIASLVYAAVPLVQLLLLFFKRSLPNLSEFVCFSSLCLLNLLYNCEHYRRKCSIWSDRSVALTQTTSARVLWGENDASLFGKLSKKENR